jgi:hypothetical protein
MARIDLRPFARVGAQARLDQLQAERERILRAFPDLGKMGGSTSAGRPAVRQAAAVATRRRKPMSAAGKKAVSERMRKYWAARREAKAAEPASQKDAASEAASKAGARRHPIRKGGTKKR